MVTDKPVPGRQPTTLRQAHEYLTRQWPGRDASTAAWVAYHNRAARLYEQVAQVDSDHYHEALYWAGYEHDLAESLRSTASGGQKGGTS